MAREGASLGRPCWGKHGNPILQREYGVIERCLVAEVQQQHYFSDRTVKYGRYALLHAARAVGAALVVFTQLQCRSSCIHPTAPGGCRRRSTRHPTRGHWSRPKPHWNARWFDATPTVGRPSNRLARLLDDSPCSQGHNTASLSAITARLLLSHVPHL